MLQGEVEPDAVALPRVATPSTLGRIGFGRRLNTLRTMREITQVELSDAMRKLGIPITQGALSKMEKRRNAPEGNIVIGLARVLRTTPNYLLGTTDDPSLPEEKEAYYSREAEEVARIVDKLSPDIRALCVQAARATSALDKALREQNLVRWQSILDQIEQLVGADERRRIEAQIVSGNSRRPLQTDSQRPQESHAGL